MKDERQKLERDLDLKSVELFGLTREQTLFRALSPELAPDAFEKWEIHFEFLEWEYDEEGTFWDAIGIDVSDGNGQQLLCLDYFGRQMVCAIKGLHPAAGLAFLGGEKSDAQIASEAQAWGASLLRKD